VSRALGSALAISRLALGALLVLCCFFAAETARAGDPRLEWWTLESPHFRVHYHGGLAPLAQRVAALAERAHEVLVPALGPPPSEVTHIVLTDESDDANGFATARPYNAIRLLVSAPDDASPLADYDDWYDELVTHEYTHVVHLDNTSGVPAILNAVFGKLYTPNDWQPRFLLEGLGVVMESEHTTGGRLHGSEFEMFLRADVLDRRFVPLDQLSHAPRRWPGSNLAYAYGSEFVAFIADIYGPSTFTAVANDYGSSVIPFGINRAIRRATGRTYPELYASFRAEVERHTARVVAEIRARGVREGTRLTRAGRIAAVPRFLPRACAPGSPPSLVYYRNDGDNPSGLYMVPLAADPEGQRHELLTRATARGLSIAPDCAILFDSVAPSRRRHYLTDLFELEPNARAPSGLELSRRRLTIGRRARTPDVSPDGRSVAYVTNRAGTSTLRWARRAPRGIEDERVLVPSADYEQAYSPRFSPDGKRLAYSVWTRGGYRDVRIVDLASGTLIEPMRDRAIDRHPAWSPDGGTLYFSSDRSGVANVYAYVLSSRALYQVTNVLTGAFFPEVSPDAKTLVYAGYDSYGFDLYALPLDPKRWLAAPPAPERPAARSEIAPRRYPVQPYTALPTLRPRAIGVSYGTGTFGNAFTLQTVGADAIGRHAFTASVTYESDGPEWQGFLNYSYGRLPLGMHASLFRSVAPRADYRVGVESEVVTERLIGLTTALSYPLPGEFSDEDIGISYTVGNFGHDAPFGSRADPWAPLPVEPSSGVIAAVHLGYSYSNASGTTQGISLERGFSLSLGVDFGDPAIGSETTLRAAQGSIAGYFENPWLDHHVLALALSGGSSGGSYPRRGLYATGGFADRPVIEAYTSGLLQSAFVLRGYLPGQFTGLEYALANAEYRFPLLHVDRGLSSLPVFLQSLSASVFADYGGAYSAVDPDDPLDVLHLGVGAELWTSLTFGYQFGATLRLGAARGLSDQAPPGFQTYFVAASGF
jgi:hypothetical protein